MFHGTFSLNIVTYLPHNFLFSEQDDDARVKRAFQTLLTYVGNVARNPDEEKFRRIRLTNQTFQVSTFQMLHDKHLEEIPSLSPLQILGFRTSYI